MSQKTFIEKTAKIGNIIITQDWSMGKYGIRVNSTEENHKWETETYEFKGKWEADDVFELIIEMVSMMHYGKIVPEITTEEKD